MIAMTTMFRYGVLILENCFIKTRQGLIKFLMFVLLKKVGLMNSGQLELNTSATGIGRKVKNKKEFLEVMNKQVLHALQLMIKEIAMPVLQIR